MTVGNIPRHVGIIMDGNGRWARKRRLPRSLGHRAGMNRMIGLISRAKQSGVKYLTLYVLSTENLARPRKELDGLFNLLRKYFDDNVKKLYAQNSEVRVIGDLSVLPPDVRLKLIEGEENSPENADFCVIFAINYGGRAEILNAAKRAAEAGEDISEEKFSSLLYTGGIPDPDFIIRTGGELRLSNFLIWQAAYAELYFTDVLFPDFTDELFSSALEEYSHRNRRFGKIEDDK